MLAGLTYPRQRRRKTKLKGFINSASPPTGNTSTPRNTMRSGSRNTTFFSRFIKHTSGPSYAPLDGGPIGGKKRSNWKKFTVAAGVLIIILWLFGAQERRNRLWSPYGDSPSDDFDDRLDLVEDTTRPPPSYDAILTPPSQPKPPSQPQPPSQPRPPSKPSKPSAPLKHIPQSPEDDPDLLKTVHCTSPHTSTKNIVQYALMVDAGSTGSRIHVYKFHNCFATPSLEYEVFKMTRPGLSKYADDPRAAAESLDVLMDEAVRVVPQSLQHCTPVAVKATAGLRLLGTSASEEILNSVRQRMQTRYPFPIVEKDGVAIMDGKDEGVYAWITTNYLLSSIGQQTTQSTTYAVLDLGGGSTQIVFEPSFLSSAGSRLEEGDHKYTLKFSGKTHELYQHSYLGYGLMSARKSIHNLVAFMWEYGHPQEEKKLEKGDKVEIANPCLSQGTKKLVELDGGGWSEKASVTMAGKDIGSFEACNRIVELVMAKDSVCEVKPCSFNGVYQPSILNTFPSGGIIILSYFYDRISPLLPPPSPDQPTSFPISTIETLARQVCAGEQSWLTHWGPYPSALEELRDRPEHCLDLTFMHALLRLGYEFDEKREVRIEKKLDGVELGWALGAAIAMTEGELTCRV